MERSTIVFKFSVALVILILVVVLIYAILERYKKKKVRTHFQNFSHHYHHQEKQKKKMRAVPRVVIPNAIEVVLTLTDNDYFGLKARVLDMSFSGFSVKPDFPLRRLPLNITLGNVLVVTPINTFAIKEMKTVRIDHQVDKRLLAFQIQQIDKDQFDALKQFMAYLDEFLKKGGDEGISA